MANNAPANVLSAASLSHFMASSLPKNSSPQLKNAFDTIALAAHSSMLAVGFRLVGLGEDHRIEASSDPSNPQPLPAKWNESNGSYSFRYAHSQSSMQFLLKINRMANKAIIMGMGMGDDKTCSFDITARDYVSESSLPATPVSEGTSDDDAWKGLTGIFISGGRMSDFGSLMRISIIQKLVPGIYQKGYEESTEAQSSTRREPPPGREPERSNYDPLREDRDPPARPQPLHDPLAQPRRPMPEPMPGFEDEFEVLRPPRGGMPGGGMPRYGDRDLYPQGLGPRDPLYGGVGPGLGPPGGGGMHPTFDDPLFAGQGRRDPGYDPQAPPGSRYDPIEPGGGMHPRGAGMGGRPPNPFGQFGDGDFI